MKPALDDLLRQIVREEIRRLVREDALLEVLDDPDDADLRELVVERAEKLRRARGGGS